MKLKIYQKLIENNQKPIERPFHIEEFDHLFEWDNLGRNLKNFWEDIFKDIVE